jgi:hypothetical protein
VQDALPQPVLAREKGRVWRTELCVEQTRESFVFPNQHLRELVAARGEVGFEPKG